MNLLHAVFVLCWASHSACTDIKGSPATALQSPKTRRRDDIYLDCHLLVEIHLHDKICRL